MSFPLGLMNSASPSSRIVFITGTDTHVGKTIATALVVYHLRRRGIRALVVKPFCSGSREDVRRLYEHQEAALSFEEINPWFFRLPLAPLVAARQLGRETPALLEVTQHIEQVAKRGDVLLVEGAGGLLVPLGSRKRATRDERNAGWKPATQQIANLCYKTDRQLQMANHYTAIDLISALDADVLVVAPNKLGTMNHTLLTVQALPFFKADRVAVVLMEQKRPDFSAKTNPAVLQELLRPVKVFGVPYLGPNPLGFSALKKNQKIIEKTLAKIFESAIFSPLFGRKNRAGKRHKKSFDSLV